MIIGDFGMPVLNSVTCPTCRVLLWIESFSSQIMHQIKYIVWISDVKQKCSMSAVWCVLSVFHDVVKAALSSAQGLQYAYLEAAGNGDLDRMEDLIGQGCPVNTRNQVKLPCALIQSLLNIRYVTRLTYISLQACRVGYLRVAAWQYVGAHTAIRGSSADLCNVENVREWLHNCSHSVNDGYRLLKKYS